MELNLYTPQDEPIDYEYMVAAKREVDKRRGEVNSKMDAQSKQAQKVYDKIDGAIADLGMVLTADICPRVAHACVVCRYQDWGVE